MKKITAILLTLAFLVIVPVVLADTTTTINIVKPTGAIDASLQNVINNALKIVFAVAGFLVLVFLIMGAFQWMMSGGEKEAVGRARSRITHALIGLAILVLAFVIASVIQSLVGIDILKIELPNLSNPVPIPTVTPTSRP